MNRVVITGSSGYLGQKLVERLLDRGIDVLGIDIQPPTPGREPGEFAAMDIGDPGLADTLRKFEPDTVIHAAFVVEPTRDIREMRRVNLDGSRNLLKAVEAAPPERLMLISSATAYGAWPDHPRSITEDQPLRAREGFPYAAHKVEVETWFSEFADRHPGIAVSRVRPAIVGGPGMDNYLRRFIFGMRFLARLDGHDQPLQFVHEADLVRAILAILSADGSGPYNIGPGDSVPVSEIARRTGRWLVPVPFWFAHLVYRIGWTLRLPFPQSPPDFLDYAHHPWVVNSKRLEEELGFSFEFTSVATVREILTNHAEASIR